MAVRNVTHPGIGQRRAGAESVPDWAVQRTPITSLIAEGVQWCQLTAVTGPPARANLIPPGPHPVTWDHGRNDDDPPPAPQDRPAQPHHGADPRVGPQGSRARPAMSCAAEPFDSRVSGWSLRVAGTAPLITLGLDLSDLGRLARSTWRAPAALQEIAHPGGAGRGRVTCVAARWLRPWLSSSPCWRLCLTRSMKPRSTLPAPRRRAGPRAGGWSCTCSAIRCGCSAGWPWRQHSCSRPWPCTMASSRSCSRCWPPNWSSCSCCAGSGSTSRFAWSRGAPPP